MNNVNIIRMKSECINQNYSLSVKHSKENQGNINSISLNINRNKNPTRKN